MISYEKVAAARGRGRPTSLDFINSIFADFTELHGDRRFADDRAVVAGLAWLENTCVTVIGIEKGKDIKERALQNFGMAPRGLQKALRQMKLAEIRASGGMLCRHLGRVLRHRRRGAGTGQAIAENLVEMMSLKTPVISVLVGEAAAAARWRLQWQTRSGCSRTRFIR